MNTPASRSAASDARVLVVDDIEDNRNLLVRRLARLGITRVAQANDGRAALDAIRSERFDLVLLDIMMPVMTGFDVLEALAAEGRIEQLPVIVISAMNEMEAVVRAISLGAEDFLPKPFDPVLLRARILPTLEKKQLRDRMRAELTRKQAELAEARSLQLSLTPPPYRDAQFSVDVVLEPAREVGGDLIDHVQLDAGRHLLVVGDVSDKGAAAALMMARTHALMRGLAGRPDAAALFADLAAVAAALNRELFAGNQNCMFVTMFIGVFEPTRDPAGDAGRARLDYIRCGHVPPFLQRANGLIERLGAAGGVPLGVSDSAPFTASRIELAPGDRLLVLSDGVTEAAAPGSDGLQLGDAGVEQWLALRSPQLATLVQTVRAHEAGEAASDDLAALLLTIPTSNN
ncbi:PP2C family protein-serine/threonine phosphatase [Paraburkholderia jirisanensis]